MSVNPPPPPPYGGPPPDSYPQQPPPAYPPPPPAYQQPQVPPPTYGSGYPPAAPPPEKKNWLPWVAGGCGCLILAAVIFGALTFFGIKGATAGAETAIKEFLKATATERYREAYAYFSAPLKESQSFEDFRDTASENLHLFKIKDTTFNERSVDTTSAKLSGSVTLESGTKVPAKFELVQENGEWKLIAYNIGTSD